MLTVDDLRPHQLEMIATVRRATAQNRVAVLHGAYGTFKTTAAIIAQYQLWRTLGRVYSSLRFAVAAMDYKQLKRGFLDEWKSRIPPERWRYNANDHILSLTDSSVEIWLLHAGEEVEGRAAERAARHKRGWNFTGWYFPQAESVSEAFFREVRSRTRRVPASPDVPLDPAPPFRVRVLDCNPDALDHWIYRYYVDPRSGLYRRALRYNVAATPATTNWTQEELDDMRATSPPVWVARMLDGRWGGTAGQAFTLNPSNFTRELPPSPRWYLGVDWGYVDHQANILFAVGDGRIHVADEEVGTGLLPDDWLPRVQAMIKRASARAGYPIQLSGLVADTNDKASAYEWQRVLKAPLLMYSKDRARGWREILRRLNTDRLTFDPDRTPETQRSFGSAAWIESPTAARRGAKYDIMPGFDHPLDAVRYLCMSTAAPVLPALPGD